MGPLAGIDGSYYLIRGIGVVGHIDSALLIGSVNSSLNTTAISDAGTATVNVSNGYNTRIVPVIDAKLGLNYTYLFTNESNSDLTLEMGYQASQYFNALDHLTGVLTEFSAVGQNSVDFMLNGPYLSLTYHV
ncbi:MAG: hypothetical protein HWD59_01320 [Coxiellaceae bacterium]|nr:MAG: hypothetical protein HWD59_01320 [Coxiellaceae bacterium]